MAGYIRHEGPILAAIAISAILVFYSLRGTFDLEWLDSSVARLCFPIFLLGGMAYLSYEIWQEAVEAPPLLKAALRLGTASLQTGVSIFALWLLSRSDLFQMLGLLTLYLGFGAVTAGILCVMFHVASFSGWSGVQGRKVALAGLLLLSNFLVAFGILKSVLDPVGHVTISHPLVPLRPTK